jgi:hypothetical protein
MLNVATCFDRKKHEALLKKYKNPDGDDQSEARIVLFVSVFAFAVEQCQQVARNILSHQDEEAEPVPEPAPKGKASPYTPVKPKGPRQRRRPKRKQKVTNPK